VNGRLTAPLHLLRRAAGSMIDTAGARDAAQVAYYLVMSFPAGLLLLVWTFSTVLNDDSVREPIVDAIVGWIPIADPGDRRQIVHRFVGRVSQEKATPLLAVARLTHLEGGDRPGRNELREDELRMLRGH
jgi:uncharacterized BrkB/YihY/UPF0761 family membrane protein